MSVFGLVIEPSAVCIYPDQISKHEALDSVVDAIASSGVVSDLDEFRRAVHERESVMSTGIGSGVAIPHVRIDAIRRATVGVGISHSGIDFNTLDNNPVNIIVLFAMPSGSQKEYLTLLAQVMTAMKQEGFRQQLATCKTPEEVVALLNTDKSH
ncbi:MAG: PTS sugar transporter subunit IIA [Candidatus Hydrogenedentes bacterium]|nr:PTS sugar transporter subunit IIA [Candidatus Hydrogenedentota bacterium]